MATDNIFGVAIADIGACVGVGVGATVVVVVVEVVVEVVVVGVEFDMPDNTADDVR